MTKVQGRNVNARYNKPKGAITLGTRIDSNKSFHFSEK